MEARLKLLLPEIFAGAIVCGSVYSHWQEEINKTPTSDAHEDVQSLQGQGVTIPPLSFSCHGNSPGSPAPCHGDALHNKSASMY